MKPEDAAEPISIAKPLAGGPLEPLDPGSKLTGREALLEMFFVLFILVTPTLIRTLLVGENVLDQAEKMGISPYWSVFQNGTLAIVLVGFILHKDRHSFKSLGLYFEGFWKEAFVAGLVLIGLFVLLFLFSKGIEIFSPEWGGKLGKQRFEMIKKFPYLSPGKLMLFTLFVGFYEELLFRGFIISRLKIAVKNPWAAVVLSSVLFAVIHSYQDPLAMVQIFFVALILGGLFVLRGNLIAPILVHAGFDFASLTMAFLISKIPPEKLKEFFPKL